jgi:hypothetical protein
MGARCSPLTQVRLTFFPFLFFSSFPLPFSIWFLQSALGHLWAVVDWGRLAQVPHIMPTILHLPVNLGDAAAAADPSGAATLGKGFLDPVQWPQTLASLCPDAGQRKSQEYNFIQGDKRTHKTGHALALGGLPMLEDCVLADVKGEVNVAQALDTGLSILAPVADKTGLELARLIDPSVMDPIGNAAGTGTGLAEGDAAASSRTDKLSCGWKKT